ncbi:protein kinase superfamily protein [Striga asiatica]|uniref:Protein kinase superfamily protein n=1 Tax=Striga asiatica TaxID=4170 RepID=A0A5A7QB49_STRAF|nr:protein kinase superfamily protein [Striga asiatica]
MGPDLGKAVQDAPRDVDPTAYLGKGGRDRRSDDSGQAVEDLEERGGLGEEEGFFDGCVDRAVAGGEEGGARDVEDLGPAEEEGPVVEDEVGSPEGGEYSGHPIMDWRRVFGFVGIEEMETLVYLLGSQEKDKMNA